MGKKESLCVCGAPFDENGICTECGKKRPRSAGYRVFHGILIVIASLIVLGCLSATLCGRHYILYHNISGGLQNSRLSDLSIGGETVTEMIRREYVQDENVLPEDVRDAVDQLDITGYLSGKADAMGKMLRGETDEYPSVSSDEIIKILEKNESALYSKCMLIIEDKDKADIRAALDEPLGILNDSMDFLYGSKAGRFLARFRVSIWRAVLDLVLLGLLLWRWIKVRRNSGKSGTGAVRGMGWVFLVPSVIVLIGCTVTALMMAFKPDTTVSIYTLVKGIRTPHWLLAPLTAGFGIFLMSLAGYIRYAVQRKEEKRAAKAIAAQNAPAIETNPAPARDVPAQNVPAQPVQTAPAREVAAPPVQTAPPQTAPAPVTGTAPAQPAVTTKTTAAPVQPKTTKICFGCGREIPSGASFCMYCGTNQNPKAANADREMKIDEILNETPALTAPSAPKVQLEKPPVTDAASADTADQSAE